MDWDFIFQSLMDFGCKDQFINYVKVLFENAYARVPINSDLT